MRNQWTVWSILFIMAMPAASRADPSSEQYRQMGLALFPTGQYPKAISYFQQAVQVDPKNYLAYEDLGDAYLKTNDPADALAAYRQSLKLHPDNPAVQTLAEKLSGSSPAVFSIYNPNPNLYTPDAPAESGRVPAAASSDGLPVMDRSLFWAKAELGYNHWPVPAFVNSADSFNRGQFVPGGAISGSTSYSGSASSVNDDFGFEGELGVLVNSNIGIGVGVRAITSDDYTADIHYNTGDSEQLTLNGSLTPITVDFYLFLPEPLGRFFISGGLGAYLAQVKVVQTTTSRNFFGTDNGTNGGGSNNWAGLLDSGNLGVQVAAGHDFAINDQFGFEIYARVYFVQISNFQGVLTDPTGGTRNYGLAESASGPTVVDADVQSHITGPEQYANLDFSGFDVGLTALYYHF